MRWSIKRGRPLAPTCERSMLIATAGHVDHGKSTLIGALTGQQTDRLREEQQRGLTIDLGFAHAAHQGAELSFVDVPGHEKFSRNMLAGVASVDAVMLVVAADDGPMPQTREHLAVVDLLSIEEGVVVITRADLVDDAHLHAVRDSVNTLVQSTSLAQAPVHIVSAQTGAGIDTLKAALGDIARRVDSTRSPPDADGLRMTIDRAFTVAGAGRVVTGTVISGAIAVGDEVQVVPQCRPARVRAIQHHGQESRRVPAGERAAVNLTGVGDVDVIRGDWLLPQGDVSLASRFDVSLHLPEYSIHGEMKPVPHWSKVQLHLATRRVMATLATEGAKPIAPGSTSFIQLVVDEPIHAVHGDRFIVRGGSGRGWLAGGRIVDPVPPLSKLGRRQRWQLLEALDGEGSQAALLTLAGSAYDGVDVDAFCAGRNCQADTVITADVGAALVDVKLTRDTRVVITRSRYQALEKATTAFLSDWHRTRPHEVGPQSATLHRAVALDCAPVLWRGVLDLFIRSRAVARSGSQVHLPDHRAQLAAEDEQAFEKMAPFFSADTLRPLALKDLASSLDSEREALNALLLRVSASGRLLRVAENRFYHPSALYRLAKVAHELDAASGSSGFEARAFRDATDIGRNLAIDVLEYFDRQGYTRRIKQTRRVIADPDLIFPQH